MSACLKYLLEFQKVGYNAIETLNLSARVRARRQRASTFFSLVFDIGYH